MKWLNQKEPARSRLRLEVQGVVQGVGFRPHVYRLARAFDLSGWVANTRQGVSLEVEGNPERIAEFVSLLRENSPRPIGIGRVHSAPVPPRHESGFRILDSEISGLVTGTCLPDLATCDACLQELFSPADRRYRYPFTNCSACGPRFSILEALPYDRSRTSMREFTQCDSCLEEYQSPSHRRYHAEPNACPACGPGVELWDGSDERSPTGDEAVRAAVRALAEGEIVAIKGIGGFHLMVDAGNGEAVRRLRKRKAREEKPFALLFPDLKSLKRICQVSPAEEALLLSPAAPIVLLARREGNAGIADAVAPHHPTLGAMLPSNPLHHLLSRDFAAPLVATSGNLSEEPLCLDEHEALARLGAIADRFLVHNRKILRPADDSVARLVAGRPLLLRRSRGYAPLSLCFETPLESALAVGGHLKNTVAISLPDRIVLSQHVGDLGTPAAERCFESTIAGLRGFYGHRTETVVTDLHPEYQSSRWARRSGYPVYPVQHHLAHVLTVMADNRAAPPALGIAWDGSGLGEDGLLWGGECFRLTPDGATHLARLRPFPLPGGERAVREGRRAALGLLYEMGKCADEDLGFTPEQERGLRSMLSSRTQCPYTTSVGRVFDAVAALLGICWQSTYEAQAAQRLEFLAESSAETSPYSFPLREGEILELDWEPLLGEILRDKAQGKTSPDIARRFHSTLAEACVALAERAGLEKVVLSGGCFQNKLLLELTVLRLRENGFLPLWAREVPTGDGGIAVGQLVKYCWDKKGAFPCV